MVTTESRNRGFTLRDAMILIAATAVGLLPVGAEIERLGTRMSQVAWGRLHEESYRDFLLHQTTLVRQVGSQLAGVMVFFLIVYTVVLFAMRLLPPRPAWRELVRQPGVWACGAASLALGLTVGVPSVFKPVAIPTAVGAAWVVLAARGRWQSEPSWLDRTGRGVGACWLALLPVLAWFAWTG
ncbi:MAG: hypothetical protein P4L84_24375 [Isosphaeraceae bacterium]|nr:hypothetical protein [Isosphaeraceae bacterium]